MKRTLCFVVLFAFAFVNSAQTLTSDDWIKDLNYLNSKIQKQFNSFVPGIKSKFQSEIDALKRIAPNLEPHEIPCEIMRVLATLQDGHTELNIGHQKVGFHRMPVLVYYFEDELRVIAAHEDYSELLGARVKTIGETPIEEIFETLKMRMSADNEMEYLHAGPGYLILTELMACMGYSDDPLEVNASFELISDEIKNYTFKGLTSKEYQDGPWEFVTKNERPLYRSNTKDWYWYKWLPNEETMYVSMSRMNNQKGAQSIKKFTSVLFKEIDLLKPSKLIIDVRRNNGGNYGLTRPIVDAIKDRAWLNQKQKLWMITGRRTFSAASTMAIFLKKETETILIGEPGRTHPNLADNNEYMNLPNSDYLIEYTTRIKQHWPERPELTLIPVDVEILPDFDSYQEGRDPVMEYILNN